MRIIACFLATFVANGLARFGFVLLIPLLIISGTLSQDESIQLGIAILIGYIFGAFYLECLRRFFSLEFVAKLSFLLIGLSFLCCYFSFLPFFVLYAVRFIVGMASAALISLAGPLCLAQIAAKYRTIISGIIFSGIGAGAVLSGILLPKIAQISIDLAWISLAGLSFLAFVFSLFYLPTLNPPKHETKISPAPNPATNFTAATTTAQSANQKQSQNKPTIALKMRFSRAFSLLRSSLSFYLWLLMISYALNAIGYLGHTLFWADFLVRDLGFSGGEAGLSWIFFGFGAGFGALLSGLMASITGLKWGHITINFAKALSCFIAAFSGDLFWLNLSVFIMGWTTTGNVVLTNALALKIVGSASFASASNLLTFVFAVFQAIFSLYFATIAPSLGYADIFIICGLCLILSFIVLFPLKERML